MTTTIVAYSPTEAALTDLATRYKDVVFDVTKPEGMADAKASYKEINTHSIILEKAREAEKAASLAHGRFVDSEAKRIAEKLDALRLPIKAQIETETKRAEREKEEKARLEVERIAAEQKALKDAEEAKMAAERADIARRQAEIAAAEKAARDKIEADQREARLKIEAEERASRLARDEADRAARQAREADEAKLAAERKRIDDERRAVDEQQRKVREQEEARAKAERDAKEAAERKEREAIEAKAKAEREAEEAKQREIRRQQAERQDARGMLALFRERYGHLDEFSEVVLEIDAILIKAAA